MEAVSRPAPTSTRPHRPAPVVGVTCDVADGRARAKLGYAESIAGAGGVPVLLPPAPDEASAPALARAHAALCDAFVLTGGDDPIMEAFGEPTHPGATPVDPRRQASELALIDALRAHEPAKPVLGVCLGMQYMALVAGGALDQCLPETLDSHAEHWDGRVHAVLPEPGTDALPGGAVHSHHRQAVRDAGRLRVVARAPDGVVEAVDDPARPFWLGVQWHPERSEDGALGVGLFRRLVEAAR